MNNGQTKPGYNIQVATENQFITNYGIFWRPADQGTLIPFLKSFGDKYGIQSSEVCADSGYGSEQNCFGCPMRGQCYKANTDRRTIEVNQKNNAYRRKVKKLLTSERGLHHRSNRPIEPEAVFGDIKFNHGFRRFLLKSNEKVNVEFGLVALAHNLRKYITLTDSKRLEFLAMKPENCVYQSSKRHWNELLEAC